MGPLCKRHTTQDMDDMTSALPFFDASNQCIRKLVKIHKRRNLRTNGVTYDEIKPISRWLSLDCKSIGKNLPKPILALRLILISHESVRCHSYVKLTLRCIARQIIKRIDNVPTQTQLSAISRITRLKQEDILVAIPLITYYQAEYHYKGSCVYSDGLDDNVGNLRTFFQRHLFRDEIHLLHAHLHILDESVHGGWLANLEGIIYPLNFDLTSSLFGLEFGHMFTLGLPDRLLPINLLQGRVYFLKHC